MDLHSKPTCPQTFHKVLGRVYDVTGAKESFGPGGALAADKELFSQGHTVKRTQQL